MTGLQDLSINVIVSKEVARKLAEICTSTSQTSALSQAPTIWSLTSLAKYKSMI
jgi:hypothetical protein